MKTSTKQYWDFLIGYLQPQRNRVMLLALIMLGSIGIQLANPQIIRFFIDTAQTTSSIQPLITAAIVFIGFALAQQVLSIYSTYFSEHIGWTATNALRSDLAVYCLRLDMGFHSRHTPGEMIERIDGDVTALSQFFSQLAIQILNNILLLIGILIIVFFENWMVGVGLGVFIVLILITLTLLRDIVTPYWTEARKSSADLFSFLEERLAGMEDLRTNGATAFLLRSLCKLLRVRYKRERKANLKASVIQNTITASFALGNAMAFALGAYLFFEEAITIGTVYLIFRYTEMLCLPMIVISDQVRDLQKAGGSIERIQALYKLPHMVHSPTVYHLPSVSLSVEFDHVTFGYKPSEPVLEDISFSLSPGKILGLLGRTGSGKTSIARLLFRLYDPNEGKILLNGIEYRSIEQSMLCERIGLVTQDVQLFHATVRDNLTFFNRTIPDTQLEQAIDDLGLGNWYASLPEGLDTVLTVGQNGLSAGEAQLLAFARVFIKKPGLVILDEASSRLDPSTEQHLDYAMDKLFSTCTGIIIAHRLSTIERTDEIIMLEKGRIYERGSRLSLSRNVHSHFSKLLNTDGTEMNS